MGRRNFRLEGQVHFAQQLLEAGVFARDFKARIDLQVNHRAVAFFAGLVQPVPDAVLVSGESINPGDQYGLGAEYRKTSRGITQGGGTGA